MSQSQEFKKRFVASKDVGPYRIYTYEIEPNYYETKVEKREWTTVSIHHTSPPNQASEEQLLKDALYNQKHYSDAMEKRYLEELKAKGFVPCMQCKALVRDYDTSHPMCDKCLWGDKW